MMEKLRIFFIDAWGWTNSSLYRSAMVCDGLMYFFGVQVAVAHQFSAEKQHGNLVALAPRGRHRRRVRRRRRGSRRAKRRARSTSPRKGHIRGASTAGTAATP